MLSHRAILTGCINGEFPDLYGHYREARYSQMKHHWWWKTNFVFSNIRILQNYDGIFDLASLNENFQSINLSNSLYGKVLLSFSKKIITLPKIFSMSYGSNNSYL